MAKTIIKNYSQAPYYDDFDESKNYHRILFRPGVSVQARELTQLQTLLQAQIDRHGQYAFKDGSRVVGGKVTVNVKYDFVKIVSGNFNHSSAGQVSSDGDLTNYVGRVFTGATSGVKAEVLQVVAQESGENFHTLYVRYVDAGGSSTATFANNEELNSVLSGSATFRAKSITSASTGFGSSANLEDGVYFLKGNFVFVAGSSLILDKFTNTPNYKIALQISEEVITSANDTSLLDNAQGVPNTSAPGANRYKIGTTLVKQAITENDPAGISSRGGVDSVTLLIVKNGRVQVDKTDKTAGTELTKRLARRTFEESGDYCVDPFKITLKEYLNENNNNGFRTAAQIVAKGLAGSTSAAETYGRNRFVVSVEPSIAYIKGNRVQTVATKNVVVEKPRGLPGATDDATEKENGVQFSVNVGNFVKIDLAASGTSRPIGIPDINGFRTIDLKDNDNPASGNVIGTARVRDLKYHATDELRLFLFDINMTGSNTIGDVKSVRQTATISGEARFQASIKPENGVTGAALFDTGNNGLVFKMPRDAIHSLRSINSDGSLADNDNNITYKTREKFSETADSNGQVSITLTGNRTFVNTTTEVLVHATGSSITAGRTVLLGGNGTLSNGNKTLAFDLDTLGFAGRSGAVSDVQVIATVQHVDFEEASKTVNNLAASGSVNVSGSLTNGELSLGKADIKKLISVTQGGVDITDKFTLDDGQRDNYYDIGKIILKPGFTVAGSVTATFDYYHHGSGDYFSVDSYPDYDVIPDFNSIQGKVSLRDCIDFRPRINDAGNNFHTGTGASLTKAPLGGQVIISDITFFQPRVDKLVLKKNGKFVLRKGKVNEEPKPPKTGKDVLQLYTLSLKPYVFDVTNDVKPSMIDNKRFTMRDIGDLEKRIKNLEYYTSLSLLEQSAADVVLTDGAGNQRLKNGFLVDGFYGHNVGDPSNPDYSAAIDKKQGILRPQSINRNVNLIRKDSDSAGTGRNLAVKNGSLVTMPFTEQLHVEQPYASRHINVNPYDVFTWGGTLQLSPESDEWKETDVRPAVVIDDTSQYDQFLQMAEEEGIVGTVWNEWETNWSGSELVDVSVEVGGAGRGRFIRTQETFTLTGNQSRSGLKTEVGFDTVTRSDGFRVVEVNWVPFIRSREINFKGQLLKPNTRVFAFFDDVDVSSFVRGETFSNSNPFEFSDRDNVVTHEGETSHPSTAGNLTTDASGRIDGSFVIPRNDSLKFATGTREFRLTDSSSNDTAAETTFAEAQYHAQGLLEVVEETIISTKVPKLVTTELNEDRAITETFVTDFVEWIDPVAETILIDQEGGLFVNSVEIFFKSVDTAIPIRLTIRSVRDGTPTQIIVPGADKVLYPGASDDNIQVSTDGTTATKFTFDHPVYLAQDQEYAIVLTAQTNNYEVFLAEIGAKDLANTGTVIDKQPYGGVFFSSANASTWTPEQTLDLKFRLNRCKFDTSKNAEINLVNDVVPPRKLTANPFTFTNGSANIIVTHRNHGMNASGSQVTIAGVTGNVKGIAAANINGTKTITNITQDTYTITAASSDTASSTGAGGGTNVTATENRQMDVMYPAIEEFMPIGSDVENPDTFISYIATIRNGQSISHSGSATQGTAGNSFPFLPNQNYIFSSPRMVGSTITESGYGSAKSMNIQAIMESTNNFLSPVIDINRTSVHTIQNRINNSGSASSGEAVTKGGSELSKYITRKVELAEEADAAEIFLNVKRPGDTDVLLFARVLGGGDTSSIEDKSFVLVNPVLGSVPVSNTFQEVKYQMDPTGATFGTSTFSTIQFKIVLISTNSSQVPQLRDFRAIMAT